MPQSKTKASDYPFAESAPFAAWRVEGHTLIGRLRLMGELTEAGFVFVTETSRSDERNNSERFWIFKKGAS